MQAAIGDPDTVEEVHENIGNKEVAYPEGECSSEDEPVTTREPEVGQHADSRSHNIREKEGRHTTEDGIRN